MKLREILIISIIVALLLVAGCAKEANRTQVVSKSNTITKTPETELLKEVEAGKLVAIYDTEMIISNDVKKENFMIIRNAYDKEQTFAITPCEGCEIESSVTIAPLGHQTIRFSVSGEGEKEIVVQDALNNYYGNAKFLVKRG